MTKNKDNNSDNHTSNKDEEAASRAIDGKWSLLKFYESKDEVGQLNPSYIPILEVRYDKKKIGGHDSCNSIFASISELNNKALSVGMIGGTKMGCRMKNPYDQAYRNSLRATKVYEINGTTLLLFDGQNNKLLEFERMKE